MSASVLIVRYGEIALKKGNRPFFEKLLIKNIKASLYPVKDSYKLESHWGRILIYPFNNKGKIISCLLKCFGIVGISDAVECSLEREEIEKTLIELAKGLPIHSQCRFKIETKRKNKLFPLDTYKVNCWLGDLILQNFPNFKVDVHNPEVIFSVDICEKSCFLYHKTYKALGGLPLGSGGKALALISGGIDSPVATWLMMKRGVEVEVVYFHTPPFTGERALNKVRKLVERLSFYSPRGIKLWIVNFTPIQEVIHQNVQEKFLTLIMRRTMIKIAEALARKNNQKALITGENLGQVASQTLEAISVIEEASSYPIFRPLIGFDKTEIISLAREIETYSISILPYQDCCSLFVPKHPETCPKLKEILEIEKPLSLSPLIDKAVKEACEEFIYC